MKTIYKYLALATGLAFCVPFGAEAQDGEAIFKQNCGACHKLGRRLVGPDLIGVNERRNEDWLLKFIKSPMAMVNSGDVDAVAIYEEFNKMPMTDQGHLSDGDIKAVLAYVQGETEKNSGAKTEVGGTEVAVVEEASPIEYSAEDAAIGLRLFSGQQPFINKGPSCISCHNVNNNALINGGLLAKDLTHVYQRMGDAGIAGILGSPPFPAMASAYGENALDSLEVVQLSAFFKSASEQADTQEDKSGVGILAFGGGAGLLLILVVLAFHWRDRLKKSVKDDIFKRQIKGNDSIIH